MLPKHYYAMVDGYNDKRKKDAELLRLSVWANKATWEGSLTYNQFCNQYFPLWFDQQPETAPVIMSSEEIENIKKRHAKYHKK